MAEPQQTLTIQQALDLAVQHHTAGRLPQAENIYQQILQNYLPILHQNQLFQLILQTFHQMLPQFLEWIFL